MSTSLRLRALDLAARYRAVLISLVGPDGDDQLDADTLSRLENDPPLWDDEDDLADPRAELVVAVAAYMDAYPGYDARTVRFVCARGIAEAVVYR